MSCREGKRLRSGLPSRDSRLALWGPEVRSCVQNVDRVLAALLRLKSSCAHPQNSRGTHRPQIHKRRELFPITAVAIIMTRGQPSPSSWPGTERELAREASGPHLQTGPVAPTGPGHHGRQRRGPTRDTALERRGLVRRLAPSVARLQEEPGRERVPETCCLRPSGEVKEAWRLLVLWIA